MIYTLEKLRDVYDIHSRIIYSGCLCREELHHPYFRFALQDTWIWDRQFPMYVYGGMHAESGVLWT